MLDTSWGKFLSLGKILAADFTRIRFSSASHRIFPVYFFFPGQLFLHQKEMDGSVSALLLTGELEARQSLFTLGLCWCKGSAQLVHKIKNLWLLEKLFSFGLKWRETLGSCGL